MKVPKELQGKSPKKKMTPEKIAEGKRLLLQRYSERFVAKQLGVSRHTLRIHCVKGYREQFKKKYRSYEYLKTHTNFMKRQAEKNLRRYHILAELFPEEMRKMTKEKRQKMGTKYFTEKMREFREKHPHYFRDFMRRKALEAKTQHA